ncbi:hypothetical protein Pint_09451 [Pistacia integerrima]|uniref:Uncharacterized protein n=1 Tax=Pistacia integerrima TaxID=434235 RepID=A0ACC0XIF9_9ROSI|nr:hypothetical protein Pint_09451 [Pistacia integerrima]
MLHHRELNIKQKPLANLIIFNSSQGVEYAHAGYCVCGS